MTLDETRQSLDQLAKAISDKAQEDATEFKDKLDAFKFLTAYYALLLKHVGKGGDFDEDDSFDFSKSLNGEANGAVPG